MARQSHKIALTCLIKCEVATSSLCLTPIFMYFPGPNGQDNVGVPSGVGGGGASHDRERTFQAGCT